MPDFPIIDTHVHFWDGGAVPISWQRGLAIDRPFLPADLNADTAGVALEAIVFVEANVEAPHHVAEADFVARLADDDPRIEAVVAHAPLDSPGLAEDLSALARRPLVRGIRHLIQGEDADELTGSAAFRAGLKQLPAHGFHFEICILHHQLAAVLRLVDAAPEVTFVLDHIAKPGIKAGLRDPWWHEIAALAALPNVTCKLSGVATEADHDAWTEDRLSPYLDRVLEVFGPDRLMFGSDWPVMRLAIDYPRWVDIVDRALSGRSAADKRKIFVETARRVYRLADPAASA